MSNTQFRTWYGGKMHRWGIFPTKTGWEFIPPVDLQAPQLQKTGLLDKNGKEIYEGDRVEWSNGDYGFVVWNAELAQFLTGNGSRTVDPIVWNECEVIGNIYENPKLT